MLAQVVFDASEATISELLKAVQEAGFAAELLQKQADAPQLEVLHVVSGLARELMWHATQLACMHRPGAIALA